MPAGNSLRLRVPGFRFLGIAVLAACLLLAGGPAAAQKFSFGVLSQRSAVLTAQYWNPILQYVQQKSGVELVLQIARTAPESNDAIARGDYDFVYSNTIFSPGLAPVGYRVIAKPTSDGISGQIVTLAGSPVKTLDDLAGKEVGFPSASAFVGYAVPTDQLARLNIPVKPVFGGNQEGIMGQLKAGRVQAAAVNSRIMKDFAARENLDYRVLWSSRVYNDIPIAVHPRVEANVVALVRAALDGMGKDAQGRAVLEASARVIAQEPPYGFVAASQENYRSYLDFYRNAR